MNDTKIAKNGKHSQGGLQNAKVEHWSQKKKKKKKEKKKKRRRK